VPKITQQTYNYLLLKGIFRIQTEYFLALIIRWSQEISARKIENQKWQHIARARKNRVLEQVVQLKNWEMTLKVFDRLTLAGYLFYVGLLGYDDRGLYYQRPRPVFSKTFLQ